MCRSQPQDMGQDGDSLLDLGGGGGVCWPCLGSPGHCSPTLLTLSPVCLLPAWQVGRISSPAWAFTKAQATNQITGLWSPTNRISMPWITRPWGTVCPTPPHPLPSQALALRAIGPHQTNSSLRAWGLGSWGTRGLVLSLGPKGKKTPEAAVGGWREEDARRGQRQVVLVLIAPAPPSGNKSATISRQ